MNAGMIWFRLLRPLQWSKNAVVFAAIVFGDPTIDHPVLRSIVAFLAFCAVSSSGYILNDVIDASRDRVHPVKLHRPIASGQVSPRIALVIAASLAVVAIAGSLLVSPWLAVVIVTYLVLMGAYSYRLKNVVLLDVFIIAAGFLLRAVAGAAAVEVPVSAWLMLCTMLLALFLAFGKRRSELVRLQGLAADHRGVLAGYTLPVLDQFLVITATCSIMGYGIYSFISESVPANGSMMLTVPFVIFAVFRYLLLVMGRGEGGAPETLLWRDKPLLIGVIAWAVAVLGVMATNR